MFNSKITEKFIHKRITNFFDECNIFGKQQFGFRKNSNTTSAIINILTRIQEAIDSGFFCAVVFLDLSKAFDTVEHEILLDKLYKLGIRGSTHELFQSYLNNRSQIVQINSTQSDVMFNKTGLPQGNILSPTLYNVYSKDIDELALKGYLQTFADDKASIYISKSYDDLFGDMQHDLNILGDWLYNNSLTANASKTKYMVFSDKKSIINTNHNLTLNNQKIDPVNTYKYLGLHLQSNLKWNDHIQHISRKVSSLLGPLIKCSYVLPQSTRLKLYYSYVYPHLTLYNEIWCDGKNNSNYLFQHVKKIQNKFIRTIYKEKYFFNNVNKNGEKIVHTIDLYKQHKILTLREINKNQNALIAHRILFKSINIDVSYKKNTQVHSHNTRNAKNIHLFKINTNKLKNGFMFRSANIHNSLPNDLKNIPNQTEFKIKLKNYIMNSGVT